MAQAFENPDLVENWGIGFDTSDQTLTALIGSFVQLVSDIADNCITNALNGGQLSTNNSTFVSTVQTIVNNMNDVCKNKILLTL